MDVPIVRWVDCKYGMEILSQAGSAVSELNRVKIPHEVLEKAIKTAPREFDVLDRKRQSGNVGERKC